MERKNSIMLMLAFLLLFVGIFDHSLWTSDEPRVAEIAREMSATGDYLVPKLSGKPFLEQPPLYYAVAGAFWQVLGTGNEGFGRLSVVLFAAGTLLVVFFGMRKLYDEHVAAISTLILSATGEFFTISHKMVVDNALTFFITAALFSFILAYRGMFKKGYMLFWVCLCGAFLTKGIVGIAIPGVGAAVFVLWQRDFSVIRKAWVIPGILLVAAAMLAWAWGLYVRGGKDFLCTFFLYNNLGRFAHAKSIYNGGHFNPFYYYIPTVLIDGLPWTILLPAALFTKKKLGDERLRFFSSWFFGCLVLLSIASTKRGLYLMPLYPALAAMVGPWISVKASEGAAGWENAVLKLVLAIIAILALAVPVVFVVKLGGSIPIAVTAFLVSAGLLFTASRTMAKTLPEFLPVSLGILFLIWATPVFSQVDTVRSYKPFYQNAGMIAGKDQVIGFKLSETVEAFCPFYGGFYVHSIEDIKTFEQMVLSKEARYVLVERPDPELNTIIEPRGDKLLEAKGDFRKGLQLWRLSR